MGTLVGTLAASDGDIGTNAVFSFSASASAPFTVQANGMWGVGHCGGDWGGGHMGGHCGGLIYTFLSWVYSVPCYIECIS